MMTKLRRLLMNVPVLRFGAAAALLVAPSFLALRTVSLIKDVKDFTRIPYRIAATAGVLIVAF